MLVATIFIACNDPYADQFVADPTINEQKPLLPNEGFEFKLGSQMESPIVLTSDDLDNGMKFELVKTTTARKVKDTRHSPTLTILPSDFDSDGFFISSLKKGI